MSLASVQDAFASALLAPNLDVTALDAIPSFGNSEIKAKQFAVYREIALHNLSRILAGVYPTVAEVMTPADFKCMSDAFFLKHPPHSVEPIVITELFAIFLENTIADNADALPEQNYLPDLATLDYGCYQAEHAIDATAVNTRIFTDLTPEMLSARRMQLHPACFWLSSAYAVYDIWQRHHSPMQRGDLNVAHPQEVVIIRPRIHVEVHRVDVGLVRTLDAIDAGETLNKALMKGSLADPAFNAVGAMQFLIQNDLILSLY